MGEPLRVLHIISSLGRRSGRMAVVMNYYRALDRTRVQFDFLYFSQTAYSHAEEITALGGRLYYLPYSARRALRLELNDLKAFFVQHATWGAVHCHMLSPGLLALKYARSTGCTLRIVHGHSTRFATGRLKTVRNALLSRLPLWHANAGMACSAGAARLLFGRGWQGKATLLPNAIPAHRYAFSAPDRAALRAAAGLADELALGTVGRFSPEKNQAFLLEVLACLRARGLACRLVLVGDSGGLLPALKDLARRMGLDADVLFMEDQPDVAPLLSMMDIFLLPSLYEGVPLSLIEAQANGLPCLVSQGVPEDAEVTGLVRRLPLENGPQTWADAVLDTIAAGLPLRAGAEGRIPNGYDAEKAAPALLNFYLRGMADD